MRQASWEELFRKGDVEEEPPSFWSRLGSFVTWEDLVTLLIVLIAFLTVVASISSADWVPEMPSFYLVAFLGLFVGLFLSRLHIHEVFAHITALAIGFAGVTYSSAGKLEGSLSERISELSDRTSVWINALISGGISNDNLPFVVLVVALTYLTAYLASWSIFRWYNPWLGLVPGGLALLTNISYLPGQNSFPLVIYLFCAILLVSRVNLLRLARDWRRQHTAYPDFISLHVLNVTVWVSLLLLALAWITPIGSGSGALLSLWEKMTTPLVEPFGDFGRLFASIDSKRGGTVHQFGSTLPLQGEISLGGGQVMLVTATEPGFLRGQSYDFYTAAGWKIGSNAQITSDAWPALRALQTPDDARRQLRRPLSVQVTTSKRSNVIVSPGQPVAVNIDSRIVFGPDQSDVTSIRPSRRLNADSQYRVDGTVSNASVGRLQASGSAYPAWIDPYLQLPSDLPASVASKAREVTAGASTAYDKANLLEAYLRTFPVDTKIKPAPSKRDSVAYFLFDAGRGYFDYHASAMVVMLRSLGVPARMTVGYVTRPQDREPDTNTYIVSDANSFAWPEVYFPGLGWVEFNPTPSEPRILRSGQDDQGFFSDPEEEEEEEELFPTDGLIPTEETPAAIDELQLEEGSSLISRIILTIVLLFVGITAVGSGIVHYGLNRGLGGVAYPVQIWEKTLRLGRWTKIRPIPQETPREVMARLKRELPDVPDLDYLGESFIRARYGQKELGAEERQRLNQVWSQVRNTLFGRLLRWK
ncbi:MAG: DUF4129 domain-containing protein [Dehalococcoidia bacterium]|nr:DUF4129 domain-containing protein [Dehalococcoidia bacterium]